jgi:hypothetical protein
MNHFSTLDNTAFSGATPCYRITLLVLYSVIGGGSKCHVQCHKAIRKETESRCRENYETVIRKGGKNEQKVSLIRAKEGRSRYEQSITKREIRNRKKDRAK